MPATPPPAIFATSNAALGFFLPGRGASSGASDEDVSTTIADPEIAEPDLAEAGNSGGSGPPSEVAPIVTIIGTAPLELDAATLGLAALGLAALGLAALGLAGTGIGPEIGGIGTAPDFAGTGMGIGPDRGGTAIGPDLVGIGFARGGSDFAAGNGWAAGKRFLAATIRT